MCDPPKGIKKQREEHRKKIMSATKWGDHKIWELLPFCPEDEMQQSHHANDFVLRKAGRTGRVARMLCDTRDVLYVTCDFGKTV